MTEARPWWRSRGLAGTALTLLLAAGLAMIALIVVLRRAEPILRARVIRTLSHRFHTRVQLDALHISLLHGIEAEGDGLRVLSPTDPSAPPLLTIRSFRFHAELRQLLEPRMHVRLVEVDGAELRIPPHRNGPLNAPPTRTEPFAGIEVDRIVFNDFLLVIETSNLARRSLQFPIANLILDDIGPHRPLIFNATLQNPKPLGQIRSTGHFGPWESESPRTTPLDGVYIFHHADLATIKGIGGMLTSNGTFRGTLGQIVVDGVADVPDFRLSTSGHALPLHTQFHAIVDGTSGDTYLQPVQAVLAHTPLTVTGSIVRQRGVPGHNIDLHVHISRGRIEDMLTLGVRSSTPFLRGDLATDCQIHIPPGAASVTRRMRLDGNFSIAQGTFANAHLQQQVNELSQRAQGWPERANQWAPAVASTMQGDFQLADEVMHVPSMLYTIPGATVDVEGQYGLDGKALDFHGLVRTQATVSELVGGWKGLLLMPFDRFLKKNGAGVEVPFKLGGTPADPKLGLDFDHRKPVSGR